MSEELTAEQIEAIETALAEIQADAEKAREWYKNNG
jgi:hypothetical protein